MIIQNRGGGNCGARDRTEWAPGGGEAGDEGFFVAWRGFSGKMLSVRFSKLPDAVGDETLKRRRSARGSEEETFSTSRQRGYAKKRFSTLLLTCSGWWLNVVKLGCVTITKPTPPMHLFILFHV